MEDEQEEKWKALMRGQVMSATINKFMTIIKLMDQKAQAMIFMNSVLIPVCIRSVETGSFPRAGTISIATAIISILAALVCIYPKRRYRKHGHRELNLLHFNDIGHMKKEDYIDLFMPVFNDPSKLADTVINDLYDTSRYSILPKYMWLKISYGTFAFGNIIAIIVAFMHM
ncbi:MAG: hypothetical protein KDI13_07075 [Alphaproteobacteria bacterium]|nr:hypothetical protein [Alphaproteobacteria bacterium]